jgi:exopolyphosphatase/guanosine-5'-triphosphate,3'-diphosphate pyrophosphatase
MDLGSNSFHLLIGEWNNDRIEIVERCSEKIQLGEDVGTTALISPQAFARGLLCLEHFKNLMDQYPLSQYWALGTNTFRVSNNSASFIAAAKQSGIEISVISGVQEAILIYAGVIASLPDIEVIIGRKHTRFLTESLAIGSVTWRDRFFSKKEATFDEVEVAMTLAIDAARKEFEVVAPAVKMANWSEVYAASGTVKMLAAICEANGSQNGEISLEDLRKLRPILIAAIVNQSQLDGLKERRRDLLLAGYSVMAGLMEAYSIAALSFSSTALREGMLDFMLKNEKSLPAFKLSNLPEVVFARKT